MCAKRGLPCRKWDLGPQIRTPAQPQVAWKKSSDDEGFEDAAASISGGQPRLASSIQLVQGGDPGERQTLYKQDGKFVHLESSSFSTYVIAHLALYYFPLFPFSSTIPILKI